MNINTAGAYILYNGYFLFMFGFNADKTKLGVVRFGGHVEPGETAFECVIREVKEECSLDIEFFRTEPIFVRQVVDGKLSVMYLTYGKGELRPSMETQGILLLRREDIENICMKNMTFKEYKESGGKYILVDDLPEDYYLFPHVQLHFLHNLFTSESELMYEYTKHDNR